MKATESENIGNEIPLILTVRDIQKLLGISINTAYGLIHSGELRAKTVGRQFRITRSEFLRYLAT